VTYPKPRKGLDIVPLPSDRLTLICSPDHPFAGRKQINLRRIDGQDFVAFQKQIASRSAIDQILRDNGVAVRIVMEFDNIETINGAWKSGRAFQSSPAQRAA